MIIPYREEIFSLLVSFLIISILVFVFQFSKHGSWDPKEQPPLIWSTRIGRPFEIKSPLATTIKDHYEDCDLPAKPYELEDHSMNYFDFGISDNIKGLCFGLDKKLFKMVFHKDQGHKYHGLRRNEIRNLFAVPECVTDLRHHLPDYEAPWIHFEESLPKCERNMTEIKDAYRMVSRPDKTLIRPELTFFDWKIVISYRK